VTEFLLCRNKLVDIPVDPDKLSLEELGFRTGQPNMEMAWKLDCR
jgi:hypothetical protein